MRFLKFTISFLLTTGFCIALSTQFAVKDQYLPAFGKLMNPFSGFWQNAETLAGSSETSGNISGLSGKVSVLYDDRQVPHIFAENAKDAIRVQGYLHAKNRLFQMDISARSAAGRLSEVLGERTLEYDLTERRFGMVRAAENMVNGWKKNPGVYELIEAYADGVNAYIAEVSDKKLPLEYKIFGFQPEKWSPLHSALFTKSMCRTLARNDMDAELSNTMAKIGMEEFYKLFPDRHPQQTPIIPSGTKWNFKPIEENYVSPINAEIGDIIDKKDNSDKEPGIGSNNWVVGPSKTVNGHPILCSDPHLNLTLPSIWYEIQMCTPEFNTYGVSLPGMPLFLIGFNNFISWAVTNSQYDVADWYRMDWADAAKATYRFDNQIMKVEKRIEAIQVKGRETVWDTVKYTHFGPVVFENTDRVQNDLAFHWVAAEENPNDVDALYGIAKARNFEDFKLALKNYSFPMQNFAFACKNGDIAMCPQGWIPIRNKGAGQLIQEGNTSKNMWRGYVPYEHMPRIVNPANSYVVSANQNTTDATYPYSYFSRNFDNFRGRRLNALLSADKKFSIDELRKMQYDNFGLDAYEFLPVIKSAMPVSKLSDTEKQIFADMITWNCIYEKTSISAMYYRAWMEQFKKMTWDELYVREKNNPFAIPQMWRTIQLLKEEPENVLFDKTDTPQRENGIDILFMSFKAGLADVEREKIARNDQNLDYGKLIDGRIDHIARIPGFGIKLYTSGNENAVNATRGNKGPSWRMVVEMGDEPHAYIVYPGGENGNPGSPHYSQFVERWENGNHYEAVYLKNENSNHERLVRKVVYSLAEQPEVFLLTTAIQHFYTMKNLSMSTIFSTLGKIIFNSLPIVLTGLLLGNVVSWWTISPIAFVFAAMNKNYSPATGFLTTFLAGFVLWSGYAVFLNYGNEGVLTERIAAMLAGGSKGISATGLILFTGLIGGFVAGLGGITGVFARNLKYGK